MITLDNVERIEVQKGPASALYGPSAMGGVVNLISRRPSRDSARGSAGIAYGSFDSRELTLQNEGGVGASSYYAVTARRFEQRDDYEMGSGETRPFTRFETNHVTARLGHELSSQWTIETSGAVHWDRDVLLPGSEFDGTLRQARKDQDQHSVELRLLGEVGAHRPTLVAYTTREAGDNVTVTDPSPALQSFLPYRSFDYEIRENGLQLRNDWNWSQGHHLLVGLDHQDIEAESRSYNGDGSARAPFSPNNSRKTTGVFVQNSWRFRDGRSVVDLGGRYDRNEVATYAMPLRASFTASSTDIDRFSPSIGFKQELAPGLRMHATAGTGFVVPEAGQLTGFDERIVGLRPQITRGNPDLKPESSVSYDIGLEWSSAEGRVDLTYFDTRVEDRITGITLANPPSTAPTDQPVVNSYTNANDADLNGIEFDSEWRITSSLGVFLNANHYFERRETVGGIERDVRNVAETGARTGVDYRHGPFSGRLSARYVGERAAQNFNVAGAPEVTYPTFVTADLTLRYAAEGGHLMSLDLANLFDRLYYETLGYSLAGRSVMARYRYSFD
jgi:vitamin B12 transporter